MTQSHGMTNLLEIKKPMNKELFLAGILTAMISFMHIGIVLGGPDWYRFFGAGEGMAQQAEAGLALPIITTLSIAMIMGIWSLYAFSGAGRIRRLPLLRPVLVLITTIFILRGLLGIPLVLVIDDPYLNELEEKMTFMVVSSLICLGFALLYAKGTMRLFNSY
jgi:putative oxidoreductase